MGIGISESGPIASAFGKDVQDVGTIVQTFVDKVAGNDILKCDLAPAFGNLNSSTIQEMDDQLKIMIAAAMMQLTKVRERSWPDVVTTMVQTFLLEPEGNIVARTEKLIKEGTAAFKSDGTYDGDIVGEVQMWLDYLIRDEDVLAETTIYAEVLGKVVAQAGAAIHDFESASTSDEYQEKTVLDVGVLRFPDLKQPYFKLYRIKLAAWLEWARTGDYHGGKSGITGEYNCRKFKPRLAVMEAMSPDTFAEKLAMADDLFE